MPRFLRLILPTVGLAVVGCGTSGTLNGPQQSAPSGVPAKPVAPVPVELVETDLAGVDQAIAERKGNVVLIDAWFRHCAPCVQKFPHVVELAEKYGPEGLAVMTVDVWEEELQPDKRAEVVAFLKEQRAAFPNYILTDPVPFMEKYGVDKTPAVVLIDRVGKRVSLPKKPSNEDVETAVRAALR